MKKAYSLNFTLSYYSKSKNLCRRRPKGRTPRNIPAADVAAKRLDTSLLYYSFFGISCYLFHAYSFCLLWPYILYCYLVFFAVMIPLAFC